MDGAVRPACCCVTPVLRFEESPKTAAAGARHDRGSMAGQFAPPFKISDLPFEARLPPPAAGEHSEEILRQSGFSVDEIGHLRAQKVI
jgi:crotonobetainyl-CoA:carnitine CoA-transferase CaiB-like acyl-CoA transferase